MSHPLSAFQFQPLTRLRRMAPLTASGAGSGAYLRHSLNHPKRRRAGKAIGYWVCRAELKADS
jgi:hypothetical protein